MKSLYRIILITAAALAAACSHRQVSTDYDRNLCDDLSVRIERNDSLSQDDYAQIIGQNEAILKYLVAQAKTLSEEPDSLRGSAWRNLTADPEYMERFGYMFTLGSALYSAQLNGRLDKENEEAYAALDDYNEQLGAYAE